MYNALNNEVFRTNESSGEVINVFRFSDQMKNILSEVVDDTAKNALLQNALKLAKISGKEKQADEIIKASQNAIVKAVLEFPEAVEELIAQNPAAIDQQDALEKTALNYAIDREDIKSIEILLKHNASSYILDKDRKSPLDHAISALEFNPKILKSFLQCGIKLNDQQ